MTITIGSSVSVILRVIAVICFALAAFGVPSRIGLVPLGLACWSLSTLVN